MKLLQRTPVPWWRAVLLLIGAVATVFTVAGPAAAGDSGTSASVTARFRVTAEAGPGETVLIAGNLPALGAWDPAEAVPLSREPDSSDWTAEIQLPADTRVEYKYLTRSGSGDVVWERVPNRVFETPASGCVTRTDRWNVGGDASIGATFDVTAHTWYGQEVYVVGSLRELGGWNPDRAVHVPTGPGQYPHWIGSAWLPPNTYAEYKYIKKNPDGRVTWESGLNRSFVTPPTGSVLVHDAWRD